MTKEDLRACGTELVEFHQRFSPCFGRIECRGHAFHYLQGQPPSRPRRDSVCSVRDVAASLPESAWQTLPLRDGTQGPVMFEFAAVRVWQVRHRKPGPPSWLVIRRSLEANPETKYYSGLC